MVFKDSINLITIQYLFMASYLELENRIATLEKDINCKKLQEKVILLEKEIKHIKAVLQYQLRSKRN